MPSPFQQSASGVFPNESVGLLSLNAEGLTGVSITSRRLNESIEPSEVSLSSNSPRS